MITLLLGSIIALSGSSWEGTIDTAGVKFMVIENAFGDVTYAGTEGNSVSVTAAISQNGESEPKDVLEKLILRFEKKGETIYLTLEYPEHKSIKNPPRIDFTVKAPPDIAAKIELVNGKLDMRGSSAANEASVVNGTILVISENPNGLYEAVNGKIAFSSLQPLTKGSLELRDVNGDISLTLPVGSSLKYKTRSVNGRIILPSGWSKGKTGAGDAELSIETVNGLIEVLEVDSIK